MRETRMILKYLHQKPFERIWCVNSVRNSFNLFGSFRIQLPLLKVEPNGSTALSGFSEKITSGTSLDRFIFN